MQDDFMRDIHDIRFQHEKERLTRFRIWYILILIIVAGLIAGGLWLYIEKGDFAWLSNKVSDSLASNDSSNKDQNTEDTNTDSWKTYADSDLEYSFKYPADWDVDVSITRQLGSYQLISQARVNPDLIIDNVSDGAQAVEFWVNVSNLKYQNYVRLRAKDKKNFPKQKAEDITFNGEKGQKYQFTSNIFEKRQQNDLVLPLSTDKTIIISYFSGSKYSDQIKAILKSIKFE